MHERPIVLPPLIAVDAEVDRDFERELVDAARLVFRVAYSVLRRREDAEDVAQEACVRAYGRFNQLRDRDRLRAWLVRMGWRLALDRQRANRRRSAREARSALTLGADGRTADAGDLLDVLLARERAGRLWTAIDALPEKLRLVVVLSSIEEHDVADVSRLLRIPEGTVKSRLFLARQRLREMLKWTE